MDFRVILDNLPYMLRGYETTLLLAASSVIGSFFTGTAFALMRLSHLRCLRWPAAVYIDVLRSIPLLMFIFWFFFLMPIVLGRPVPPVAAMIVALIAFNTSYMAEVVRAGIQSVPRTQMEAGRSTGLGYLQVMLRIVLPQAYLNMLPTIVSRMIALFMSSSLAYIIGVTEFFRAVHNVNSRVFEPYTLFVFAALVYFCSCFSLSLLARYLQHRFAPATDIEELASISG
jgi:His/Glu/Gln/Arg/opine family amino acid ABC transporter permease subunit